MSFSGLQKKHSKELETLKKQQDNEIKDLQKKCQHVYTKSYRNNTISYLECLDCGKHLENPLLPTNFMKCIKCGVDLCVEKFVDDKVYYFNMYRSYPPNKFFTRLKQAWEYFRTIEL